jgi:glycosyltransferase involved in cell wall biosynthesis
MRIGIEVQNMLRPRKHGMEIVILEVLRELQQAVSKHEYFLYAQPDEDVSALKINKNMHLQLAGPASFHTWEQRLLPEVIKSDNISLLHCTSSTAPISLKVPLIVTIHDIIYLEKCMMQQGSWYQRFGHLYRRWNVPRIAKRAELIIAVSEFERERIIEGLNIAPEKVKTIHNACGKHFTPERNEYELITFRQKFQLPGRFILFLGNHGPKKNMPNVIRALDILYQRGRLNFVLVIPDMSKNRLLSVLEAQESLHLLRHIHLTGYIPNNELPNLYRLAELFIYPSLASSFGIPILEAMACGTPVITSNTSAMPEVAGKDALFIDPKEPGQLADMILKILDDQALRKSTVAYGIERASLFSWQRTAAQVVNAYESIM